MKNEEGQKTEKVIEEPNNYEMEIEGRKIRVRDVDITHNDKLEKVVIRKFDFIEGIELEDSYMKKSFTTGQPELDISWKNMVVNTLTKGIVNAPFEISEAGFRTVDPPEMRKIYREIEIFNKTDEKKNQN